MGRTCRWEGEIATNYPPGTFYPSRRYSHPKFQAAVKTIFRKARAAGVGAMIHHIGEIFGDGMQVCAAAKRAVIFFG